MAERGHGRLHPLHVAVMVGAPDVDHEVEAAVVLVGVVRDVRREVRVAAVGLLEHAVLVVAEVGGAEPERTFMLEEVAGLAQPLDAPLDRACCVQGALGEPHVEVDAHAGEHPLQMLEHSRVGLLLEVRLALTRWSIGPRLAFRLRISRAMSVM